jgi:hypothetical protein
MMTPLQIYLIIFFSTVTLIILLLNIWSKGFVFTFLRVRGRRDKGQLVLVNSASDAYWRGGVIDGDWLIYKDRNKNKKRLFIGGAAPRRIFGLPVWETDETKNALNSTRIEKKFWGSKREIVDETSPNLLVRNWEVVEGHDAVKTDNLYERLLTAPSIKNNKELLMIIGVAIILLLSIYIAYKVGKIEVAVKSLNVIVNTPASPL